MAYCVIGFIAQSEIVAVFLPGQVVQPVKAVVEYIQEVLQGHMTGPVDVLLVGDLFMIAPGQRRVNPVKPHEIQDKCHNPLVIFKSPDIFGGEEIVFIGPESQALLIENPVITVRMDFFADLLCDVYGIKHVVFRRSLFQVLDQTGEIFPSLGVHVCCFFVSVSMIVRITKELIVTYCERNRLKTVPKR